MSKDNILEFPGGEHIDVSGLETKPHPVPPGPGQLAMDLGDPDLKELEKDLPGQWNPTGWRPPKGGLEWDDFRKLLEIKRFIRKEREKRSTTDLWQLSDILNWGLFEFGQDFYDLFDETHYVRESLGNIARIGAAFEDHRRWDPEVISFWTHGEVATLNEMDGDELLEQYAAGELTRSELREEAQILRDGKAKGASGGKSSKDSGQLPILETCPLCDTPSAVTPEERAAYFREHFEGRAHAS